MDTHNPPKVILFDIGGVCVVSPFQSILDHELSLGIPPGWVNYSISKTAPTGFWHRLETGSIPMDTAFFAGFNRDLHDPVRWKAFYKIQQDRDPALPREIPPVPNIDAEFLFHEMMYNSQRPDPWMLPALKNLKASRKFILAALSNTVIFPEGHELYTDSSKLFDGPVRSNFDLFISSAHVGLRKPDPKMYQLALKEVNNFASRHAKDVRGKALRWEKGIQPEDILFLDDIGENLREARKQGFQTLKVNLGRAFDAVDELEKITGLKLAGDHPKIAVNPNFQGSKAKI
jgi:FMN phosphatase YigB (HAD superfamily)